MLLVMVVIGIYLLIWNMTQHHFPGVPEDTLRDLTVEEQKEVLDAFDLIIPENEKNAYVYSFSCSGGGDERLLSCMVEIGGVEDYEGFYAANTQSDLWAFNETTRDHRTDKHYFILYRGTVDTKMKPLLYKKYSDLYNRLKER